MELKDYREQLDQIDDQLTATTARLGKAPPPAAAARMSRHSRDSPVDKGGPPQWN